MDFKINTIYLDHHATTPLDPEVLKAMMPYFTEKFGNPASLTHAFGWEAEAAVDLARESIAKSLNSPSKDTIFFTSGTTEANNMVLLGLAHHSAKPIHIITQKTEHKCVLETCKALQKEGHEVTFLDVDELGVVKMDDLKKSFKPHTLLCSIMTANNEVGTIQPVREIGKLCREHKVYFHTDSAQAVGKVPVDVVKDNIDFLTFSGHKIYGPKGVGGLFISPQVHHPLKPLTFGGGQEKGLRSGTLNVPGIVGLAKALEISIQNMSEETARLQSLRSFFMEEILKSIPGTKLNGPLTKRLPHNINFSFEGVKSDDLIRSLPQIAIASGSACGSGNVEPSYVISAMTHDPKRATGSIRIGLGRWTTQEEVDKAAGLIIDKVKKLRK